MKLPKQLQNPQFRFIKIRPGTKKALESKFQDGFNYKYTESEFQDYLKSAKAYGVLCGCGRLAVIDCDLDEVRKAVVFKLPATFSVKTGSGKYHYYYIIKDLRKKIILKDKEDAPRDEKGKLPHYGEVQFGGNTFVVGAGSKHPSGGTYKVHDDIPIAEITEKKLLETLKPFMKDDSEFRNCNTGLDLDIAKVVETIPGLDRVGDGLQGTHPVHGSDGGMNFRIDNDHWHCFRHNTGGDALSLIGVLEGIIKCEDCVPGYFKTHKDAFRKILRVAKEKYKYDVEIKEKSITSLFTENDKGKKFLNTKGIAEFIKEQLDFIVVADETGRKPHIYYYDEGYYKKKGGQILEIYIKKLFGELWKTHYRNEILEYLRTENLVERDNIIPPSHLVNLNNGVFNLRSSKLEEHSPKHYFLYKIPWNYNTQAKCPKAMKYFKSTLLPQYIELSQEIFGYCLYAGYPHAAIFYLYGIGGNGKTVWIKLLTELLGTKNIVAKELYSIIKNKFTAALLYGKLANLSGELTASVLKETDVIKRLSSGDYMQAEFKGLDGFDFLNTAKIITSCNSIPHCTDMTDGWYQRQYIVPFLKTFRRTNKEKIDLDKMITSDKKEMEGLLLWALEGLQRVLKTKKFTYPKNQEELYKMYQRNCSYFIERHYIKTQQMSDYLELEEIWDAYCNWCKENNIPRDTKNALSRQLTYFKFPQDQINDGKKSLRVRRYITKVK